MMRAFGSQEAGAVAAPKGRGAAVKGIVRRGAALWRAREGSFLVEYALFAPVVLVMLAVTFDVGMAVYDNMSLKEAARAGVQYMMDNPSDSAGLTQAVADSTGLDPAKLTVTGTLSCQCADGSAVACGGTCAVAGGKATYATVLVQEPFAPLLPYPGFLTPDLLKGSATLRIR